MSGVAEEADEVGNPAASGAPAPTEAPSAPQANDGAGEPTKASAACTPAPARKTRGGTKQACVGAARYARTFEPWGL